MHGSRRGFLGRLMALTAVALVSAGMTDPAAAFASLDTKVRDLAASGAPWFEVIAVDRKGEAYRVAAGQVVEGVPIHEGFARPVQAAYMVMKIHTGRPAAPAFAKAYHPRHSIDVAARHRDTWSAQFGTLEGSPAELVRTIRLDVPEGVTCTSFTMTVNGARSESRLAFIARKPSPLARLARFLGLERHAGALTPA